MQQITVFPPQCRYNLSLSFQICGKHWSSLSKLNRHKKTHSGIKSFPYVCEMCGEAFARKNVLDSHRLKHTGEAPYKCEIEVCCYMPGVTRKEFGKPKFCYLESQQKALLKFNKIY